jgi:RNA polymerase sigma-70 factor (ECF subfamily)
MNVLHSFDQLEEKEMTWLIKRAIRKLPAEQKEALILREYQNLSYEQISQVLNISLENVKVTIFRAREQLRKDLTSVFKEEGL